jgi:hypothetical protein
MQTPFFWVSCAGLPLNTCLSDKDCTTGFVCSTTSATQQCTCELGVDNCRLLGSCIDYCRSSDVESYLDKVNSAIVTCDPFLPNQCSGTLVCQSSTRCKTLTCEPGKGIVSKSCGGLCMPADRMPLSARLSDDGKKVVVMLNAPARSGGFPCASLLSPASMK